MHQGSDLKVNIDAKKVLRGAISCTTQGPWNRGAMGACAPTFFESEKSALFLG
jgi:hypothetical protein